MSDTDNPSADAAEGVGEGSSAGRVVARRGRPPNAEHRHLPSIPLPLLIRVATALHGEAWVTNLADDLGVQRRSVSRWRVGHGMITPRIAPELDKLLEEHIALCRTLQRELWPYQDKPKG